MLYPNALVKY